MGVIYIRCSIGNGSDVDTYYMHYREFNAECYINAIEYKSTFWVQYVSGWAIYIDKELFPLLLPITYAISLSKKAGEYFEKVSFKRLEEELLEFKSKEPEYFGSFYIDGRFDKNKFRYPEKVKNEDKSNSNYNGLQ